MRFKIVYSPDVKEDVQEAIDWYNSKQRGLGSKFVKALKKHFKTIKENPFGFAERFENIRCLPLKKYPYMIFYWVNEENKTVYIEAVFNTHQDPESWNKRT